MYPPQRRDEERALLENRKRQEAHAQFGEVDIRQEAFITALKVDV